MTRRGFNKAAVAALLSRGFAGTTHANTTDSPGQLDCYGGWTGKRFKATGFFRVEKDERWWLVTPEGNAFLSFGINHLHSGWWKQKYNAKAWAKRLGVDNLNGPEFGPALRNWFLQVCREYGFNTAGVHTDVHIINKPHPSLTYMQPIRFVDIPHWKGTIPDANFLDVFSAEFEAHCDRLAKAVAGPAREDPYLLGYSMTDCPLFTEEDCRERPDVIGGAPREARIGWPRRLRNLGAKAPGKAAYVALMQDLYRGKIDDFNATYGTRFDTFDALASAENWRPHTDLSNGYETRDNVEFLKRVVAKYYRTARDAIRRYDPNHLFAGDKINANTDAMDTVLSTTSTFTDVVLYQMYGHFDLQETGLDRWSRVAGKPFINGDAAFTMITETMPRPYGPVADDVRQRAEWTEEFFRNAFARPDFVGWHYCGLIDAPNLVEGKKERQHSGLMDGYGEPHPRLMEVLKSCAEQMYAIGTKETS